MLDTVVFTDPAAIEFFDNEMLLVKINAEEDSMTAERYHVMGYPTSVMVDMDGNEVDRLIGFAPADEYIETFRNYAKGIGTLDDLLAQFETEPDRMMAFEIADKYKYRGEIEESRGWYGTVVEMGEPTDSLSGESRFAVADGYRRADMHKEAKAEFESIMKDFEGTDFAEGAELYRAITIKAMGDTVQAAAAFEQFAANYPESNAAEYATGQAAELRGEGEEETEAEEESSK